MRSMQAWPLLPLCFAFRSTHSLRQRNSDSRLEARLLRTPRFFVLWDLNYLFLLFIRNVHFFLTPGPHRRFPASLGL